MDKSANNRQVQEKLEGLIEAEQFTYNKRVEQRPTDKSETSMIYNPYYCQYVLKS